MKNGAKLKKKIILKIENFNLETLTNFEETFCELFLNFVNEISGYDQRISAKSGFCATLMSRSACKVFFFKFIIYISNEY